MEHGGWRWVRIHIESVLVQYSGVPVVFPHKSAIRSDPPTKGMTRGHMRLSVPNIPPSVLAKSALRNVPRRAYYLRKQFSASLRSYLLERLPS